MTVLHFIPSGVTPGFALRIISGGASGTIWDAGDRTWVDHMQGKHPTLCTIEKIDEQMDHMATVQFIHY